MHMALFAQAIVLRWGATGATYRAAEAVPP
jgi:hypothetical protein